ncbi:MAG: 2-hydroxyacyl-CoA dehydratase family protein [Dehalococcoidia bacterium]
MEETLKRFIAAKQSLYDNLKQWKKASGKKIIGCHPMDIPEEIVHAAGMLPITLMGFDGAITHATRSLQPTIACNILLENLEMCLNGTLDFLDGVIFADVCDTIPILSDIWLRHSHHVLHHLMVMPKHLNSPSSRRRVSEQFLRLKAAIEKQNNKKISDRDLKHSIGVYNQNRRLLKRLCDLRRCKPGLLSASDVSTVVTAGMLMRKEDHNQLVEQLLLELENLPVPTSDMHVKLIVSGSLCGHCDSVLSVIDAQGAYILEDDLYIGSRYFTSLTNEYIDPIEALAQRYVDDIPSPTKFFDANAWANYISNMVIRDKADGIIIVMRKLCEIHADDFPCIQNKLNNGGIPCLMIEIERAGVSEQDKTRIQAFIDMLGVQ